MGLSDLIDEEIEELKKDIRSTGKGKTLEELLKEIYESYHGAPTHI